MPDRQEGNGEDGRRRGLRVERQRAEGDEARARNADVVVHLRRRGDLAPARRETGDLGAVRRQGEGAADADEPRAAAGPHQGIGGIAVLQQIVDVRDLAGHHAQPGGAGGGSVHSTQPNPAGHAADAAA